MPPSPSRPLGFDPAALDAAIAELGEALQALDPAAVPAAPKPRAVVRRKAGTGRLESPRAPSTGQLAKARARRGGTGRLATGPAPSFDDLMDAATHAIPTGGSQPLDPRKG